ncbi:MAG: hypothetical protein M3373_03320 [Gemmatimonadota bacterium]|nr:hypothetical protein [Gemmatimonadota bacterium]
MTTLYWWGAVPLEAPDNLVEHFFAHADAARRVRALHYLGFSLYHTEKPVPDVPLRLLRELWAWRFARLRKAERDRSAAEAREARREMEEFGWWFASRAFDPGWALAQLEMVYSLIGIVEFESKVLEYLDELSVDHPAQAVACLAALDLRAGEPWRLHPWIEHARAILANALARGNGTTTERAIEVINRLVANGYTDFRTLLSP